MTPFGTKLKHVSLHPSLTRSGDDTWRLLHADGWQDPFFDQFATHLLKVKKNQYNTREKYCRFVAAFIDYMLEAAQWYREEGGGDHFSGQMLTELVQIYPKVLAGGNHSKDPVVVALSNRLGRSAGAHSSQVIHISAINTYLKLSESFNTRMAQGGYTEYEGLPLLPELSLFPTIGSTTEVSRFRQTALSSRSMLAGVVAGGAKIQREAYLTPEVVDQNVEEHYDYDSAFPIDSAQELISKGFNSYRDRAIYCLLAASGIRISEALALTWHDVDTVNRRILVRNPRIKSLDNVYQGYFTLEDRKKLPWKGRAHPHTLLIEPFASEFWRLLGLYMDHEYIYTDEHPFIWQVIKDVDTQTRPLLLTDHSNLRTTFRNACIKIGLDPYSPHSLRHMYGVYCVNYWPNGDGKPFGLPFDKVMYLMGHSMVESTMHYAKPKTHHMEVEQRVNSALLAGAGIADTSELRVNVINQMLDEAVDEMKQKKAAKLKADRTRRLADKKSKERQRALSAR